MWGRVGESRPRGICALELQESDHQNQPVSTLCSLGLGSIGGAQAMPLPPPGPFLFGGDGERGGALLCVWLGGGGRIFRLLLDAGPGSLGWWGCTLITYLIREEFKLCFRKAWGRGWAATPGDHHFKSCLAFLVRCLLGRSSADRWQCKGWGVSESHCLTHLYRPPWSHKS